MSAWAADAPRRVVLFGSRARSTARPDSDVDLMVELDTPLSPAERVREVLRLFGVRRWSMDVLVFTPAEIAAQPCSPSSLVSAIEREERCCMSSPDGTGW